MKPLSTAKSLAFRFSPSTPGSLILTLILTLGLTLLIWAGRTSSAAPPQAGAPPQTATAAGKTLINLFFSAKRESSLEPCGCHTEQRGGIQYEGANYAQHTDLPGLRLDAGGWAISDVNSVPVEAMKTRYLLRGLVLLQYDALNIGWTDAELAPDFIKSVGEKYPGSTANLVSANLYQKADPTQRAFQPWRIVQRKLSDGKEISIGIVGLTGGRPAGARMNSDASGKEPGRLENRYYLIKPAAAEIDAVLKELRPKVELLIVLFDGDLAASVHLAEDHPGMDFLISSGYEQDPNVLTYRAGLVRMLSVPNNMGKEIGFAPLTINSDQRWDYAAPPRSMFVRVEDDEDPKLHDLIEEFKKETKSLDILQPPGMKQVYAGAETCRTCHTAEYNDWSETQHARALATLINKSQESNPECLKCHTVGFQKDNGFYSVTQSTSRMMSNVQCENCHGPANEHQQTENTLRSGQFWMPKDQLDQLKAKAKTVIPKREVAEATCFACHTPENDNKWNYAGKLPKVDHHAAKQATATPQTSSTINR